MTASPPGWAVVHICRGHDHEARHGARGRIAQSPTSGGGRAKDPRCGAAAMELTPDAPLQPRNPGRAKAPYAGRNRKRIVLLVIFVLSWVSTALAWYLMESQAISSPVLRGVFIATIVFLPLMFAMVYWRLLPERLVDIGCLLFAAGICAACMVLRLYFPAYGESIDLEPLYLWILVIYVFAFTVAGHRSSLAISLGILALFLLISLPYLVNSRPSVCQLHHQAAHGFCGAHRGTVLFFRLPGPPAAGAVDDG
jgi:hypothetical protein